ncbi:hypothetical protein AHAS_Ahas17G0119900 [Arachis hypogaea]
MAANNSSLYHEGSNLRLETQEIRIQAIASRTEVVVRHMFIETFLGVKHQLLCQFGRLTPAFVPVLELNARILGLTWNTCLGLQISGKGGQNPTASAVLFQPLNQIFAQDEEFEATYEAGDEDEDGDEGGEVVVKTVVAPAAVSQSMDVPPFMRSLDLDAMHTSEFPEYVNIGVADSEDGEFRIGMEYASRKSVIAEIQSYTISR